MKIRTFDDLRARVTSRGRPLHIACVRPTDEASREALERVRQEGIARVTAVDAPTAAEAAARAVEMVRSGAADVLMKGLIGTDELLRAVLDRQHGLRPAPTDTAAGAPAFVLTHLSVAQIPAYDKLLFFTDAAVIPYPTHEQRLAQVRYAVAVCHTIGIEEPRVALIHCSEKPSDKFPFVAGYADIKRLGAEGAFGRCLVDGPLDVKSACSRHALQSKGIASVLDGKADVLVMPDIEAGNAFYKSMTLFAQAKTAGILLGPSAPVVVPSRGDNAESKYHSILFALSCLS